MAPKPRTWCDLRELEVRVALVPLLQGRVQVEKVRLLDPVVELETLADGRNNWEFSPPPERDPTAAPEPRVSAVGEKQSAADSGDSPVSVQFDSLEIVNGVVVYRDGATGTVERIEGLTATVAAGSLRGPFEGDGHLTARGFQTGFKAAVGEIDGDGPVAVNLVLTPKAGKARFELRGKVGDLSASPSFTGRLDANAGDTAGLIRAVAGDGGDLPGFLSQPMELQGEVTASASRVDVSDLSLRLGSTGATGAVSAILDDGPAVSAQLAISHLNLDSWLDLATPAPGTAPVSEKPDQRPDAAPSPAPRPGAPTEAGPSTVGGMVLPDRLSVSLAVSSEAITYRGGIIRDVRVEAELAGGEIAVSKISGNLPGATEVAASGVVTVPEGTPRFEGKMDAKAGDARGLLRWLDVDTAWIPPGRVRAIDLKGKLSAIPGAVGLRDADLQFDTSRVTGRMALDVTGRRPALDADLGVDRIDVDAYLPAGGASPDGGAETPPATAEAAPGDQPTKSASGGGKRGGPPKLTAFDARVKARAGRLIYKGTPFETVVLDAALLDGVVDVSEASVGDVAGASGRMSGIIEPLAQKPGTKQMGFEFDVPSLERLLRAFDLPRPDPVATVGPFVLSGTMDGPLFKPTLDVTLRAAGGETQLSGILDAFPKPVFSGRVKLSRVDLVQVLDSLGADYRPSGRIGAIDLAGRLDADASRITLIEMDGAIGDTSLAGSIDANFAGARPTLSANLKTGRLVIDPFLPAEKTAGIWRLVPASWGGTPQPRSRPNVQIRMAANVPHQRWSREPMDLSALKAMDATLTLKSDGIVHDRIVLEDVDAVAKLAGGVLTAEPLTGLLFRGPFQANLRFDANGTPSVDGAVSVKNADLSRASRDDKGRSVATGQMTFAAKAKSRGVSTADLVAGLGGSGSLRLSDVEVGKGVAGGETAAVINLLQQLNAIGAGLGASGGRAQVTATFRIADGVVRTDDIALESGLGEGGAQGTIDLAGWNMDVNGQIRLRGNILTGLMIETEGPPVLPFRVRGPLDDPRVNLDANALKVRRVVIPDPKDLDVKKGLKELRKLFRQ